MASQPQKKSSLSVSQSHFVTFTDWCTTRGTNLESVSVHVVADYLFYMFSKLNCQVETICKHRTALSSALGVFDSFLVGNHPVVSNLITRLYVETSTTKTKSTRLGPRFYSI